MAEDTGPISGATFFQLGRVWSRVFWSVLLVPVIVWDVFAFLSAPTSGFLRTFLLGLASGLIRTGFVLTLKRER